MIEGQCLAPSCPPGEIEEDGECRPAGLPVDLPCKPAELLGENGICQPAGIPEESNPKKSVGVPTDGCHAGFTHDGAYGCAPDMPKTACLDGNVAVPGDSSCHEVAECGTGTWGNIVTDANTHYVDKNYVGPSDGSINQPHKNIVAAINAAPDGGIVAVAAGTYSEYVIIYNKKVLLRGRCPSMVNIVVPGSFQVAPIYVSNGGGSEISGLQISSSDVGMVIENSTGVLVDKLWIHDNTSYGLYLQRAMGPTEVTVTNALFERNTEQSIVVRGSKLVLDKSLVRDTTPDSNGYGYAIYAYEDDNVSADVLVTGSVFERNGEGDVVMYGSKLLVQGSVFRDPIDVNSQIATSSIAATTQLNTPSEVTIQGSVFERVIASGVGAIDSSVTVENATFVDLEIDSKGGTAAAIGSFGSTVLVKNSAIVGAKGAGIISTGSQFTIESTAVSNTSVDGNGEGAALVFQPSLDDKVPSNATIKGSLIEATLGAGIFLIGSTADIQSTVVFDTEQLPDGRLGHGVSAMLSPTGTLRSDLTLRRSLIEKSQGAGVYVQASTAKLAGVVVNNSALDETAPHGIGVMFDHPLTAQLTIGDIEGSLIDSAREAGVLVRSAEVQIKTTAIKNTDVNSAGELGIGIDTQTLSATAVAEVTVGSSIIEGAHRAAISSAGAQLTVDSCAISNTDADATGLGVGIASSFKEIASVLIVRGTTIDGSVGAGMLLYDTFATLEGNVIAATAVASPNLFGDALSVVGSEADTVAILRGNVLSASERAAIIASDATVRYEALELACQLHDLVGLGQFSFVDTGGARCGCPDALGACDTVNDVLLDIPEKLAGIAAEL